MGGIPRRAFNKAGAAAIGLAATAIKTTAAEASNRIRLGFIGVGNRGTQDMDGFLAHKDCEVVAISDVYQPFVDKTKEKLEKLGSKVDAYEDYRKILERKDIDAVVIATPDHWHALQMIHGCQAEKDVYVEKPLSITIVEGRRMVDAARKHNRVVQVGLHRRSMGIYHRLAETFKSGKVGKVSVARAYRLSNMAPNGIGKAPDSAPLAGLNWDMWLGPRAERAFNQNIHPYKFRWWQNYSSQMGNWGVHYCDAIRWMLGETAPVAVSAHGGKYVVDDSRDIPDTMEATFELPSGCLLVFGQYEGSGAPIFPSKGAEIEFRGTQGVVYSSEKGFEIIPERGGQFQDPRPRMEAEKVETKESNATATANHARNFLDCVKSRQRCHCDIEEGHRSTTFAHLANIALATKSRLEWDAEKERITNNDKANEMLHYEYRSPWILPTI